MALQLKHASKVVDRNEKEIKYSETLYGTEAEINAYIASLSIGDVIGDKGSFSGYKKYQDTAFWNADFNYTTLIDDLGGSTNPNTLTGPNSQHLSCRLLSMPLETKKDKAGKLLYRANWNYYLIGKGANAKLIPSWWESAEDTFIDPETAEFKRYRWIKSLSEIPTSPEDNEYWQIVKGGSGTTSTICRPSMAGIESYDLAVYTITETGKHSSKNKAGWAVAQLINTVVDEPLLGDFGLTAKLGGDWKIDDADVRFDGRWWIGTRTYTKSGDSQGWNKILYDKQ